MKTAILSVGFGCFAILALACGDKGEESSRPTTGSGGKGGAGGGGISAGGSSGTAGNTGVGGNAGSGGSGGAGGGAPMVTKSYSFDTDTEGWKVQYSGATTGMPVDKSMIMLKHDATDGDPSMGSLEVSIPWSAAGQNVDIGVNPTGVDLGTKTITARIKIVSGYGDPMDLMTNPAIARLYAKSGQAYVYANSTFNNLSAIGTWNPISWKVTMTDFVAMSDAGTWDPSNVTEIGVQLETSGTAMMTAPAVVRIDTVTY